MAELDYTTIDPAYNDLLERTDTDETSSVFSAADSVYNDTSVTEPSASQSSDTSTGNVETQVVKSSGGIGDIWITSFIKSTNYKPKSQGFMIDGPRGYIEGSQVWISGTITASAGKIGGWNIFPGELSSGKVKIQSNYQRFLFGDAIDYDTGTGIFIGLDDTLYKFRAGNPDGDYLGWDGVNLNISGAINATSGTVGGWHINTHTLSSDSDEATSDVLIDSQNKIFRIGTTSGGYIVLDGPNQRIRSSNYVSGVNGAGFSLDGNLLEVGNIAVRGMIRNAVFQKDVVSAVGGNLMVMNSDSLSSDMSSDDNSTLQISGESSFSDNDIIRIKDGIDDEWLQIINSSSPGVYNVTRDLAGDYSSNNNPEWKKGAAVVSYGQSGDGGVYMTASEEYSPYISIFTQSGAPWTNIDTKVRLGNLEGLTDPSDGSPLSGYGLWTDNAYLSGAIVANSGKIGGTSGWDISTGKISSTSSGNTTEISTGTEVFLAGPTGDPSFIVTSDGELTASAASIIGTIDVGDYGAVKGGQTEYNNGVGFFLGYTNREVKDIDNSEKNTVNFWPAGSEQVTPELTVLQHFRHPGGTVKFSKITLYLSKDVGQPDILVTVNIYIPSSSSPIGTNPPILTTTINVNSETTTGYDIDISSLVIYPGELYGISVYNPSTNPSGMDVIWWPGANPYTHRWYGGPGSFYKYDWATDWARDFGGIQGRQFSVSYELDGKAVSIGDSEANSFLFDGSAVQSIGLLKLMANPGSGQYTTASNEGLSFYWGGDPRIVVNSEKIYFSQRGWTSTTSIFETAWSEMKFSLTSDYTATGQDTVGGQHNRVQIRVFEGKGYDPYNLYTPSYSSRWWTYYFGSAFAAIADEYGRWPNLGTREQLGYGRGPWNILYVKQIGTPSGSDRVGAIYAQQIGNSSYKTSLYGTVYSCPLPVAENALESMKNAGDFKIKSQLKDSKLAHFEDDEYFIDNNIPRKYLDIQDAPKEILARDSNGREDIELVRTVGFLYSVVKELSEKVSTLEQQINNK